MERNHPGHPSLWRPLLATAVASVSSSVFAADGVWNANASGNWSDDTKWTDGIVADGATFTATFDAALSSDRTITLDGARTIGHLSFLDNNGGNQRFTISGANTLTLNADGSGGGTSSIDVGAGTIATIGGSSLVLAGSSNIEKTGAGTLTLATDNTSGTFTGGITVSNGTLGMSAANALRNIAVTLDSSTNNATLSLGVNSAMTMGSLTVASGGTGTATLSYGIANGNTLAGNITLNKGLTVSTGTSAMVITTGSISGTGGITKTGSGTLTLRRSNNTFEGGVTLSQGTLRLNGGGNVAGTGTVVVGDADTGASNVVVQVNQNSGGITNAFHFTNNGTGTAALRSYDTDTGGGTSVSGNILLDRSILLQNTNASSSRNFTVSGVISGAGGIDASVNLSTNRLILTGANTYSGGTTITTGTLRTGNASALGTGQVAFHESNTTALELNNTALSVQSLSGGGSSASVVTGGTSGILTITGDNVSAASFAGVISGTGGLVKNGAGEQILTGANTFSGATEINGGTLRLGSGSAVGLANTSGVTIAGGTLVNGAGDSALGVGAVSMSSGAITPGGVGTVGSFTVASGQTFATTGGTLNFDLESSSSYDQILGSGAGIFSLSDTTIALSGLTSVGGSYQLFDGFGGFNLISNLSITGLGDGFEASLDSTGLLTITGSAIPEPAAFSTLAGLALLAFAGSRRRR